MVHVHIIGAGKVGSQVAFGLVIMRRVEISLSDANRELLKAQCIELKNVNDLLNGEDGSTIDMADSLTRADIYVLAFGENSNGGQFSRESLYERNGPACNAAFRAIAEENPDAWVFVVTNPSHRIAQDGLNYLQKVIPVGQQLDAARIKSMEVFGSHEKSVISSPYEDIIKGKGYTAFGPAAEVIQLIRSVYG